MNHHRSSTNPDLARDAAQLAMGAHFLRVLAPGIDEFCFQTFDDRPRKDASLARTFHGTLAGLAAQLQALNRRGAGVFVTINSVAQGQRRLMANVTDVRSVFADNDNPVRQAGIEEEIARRGLPPSIIVESSRGKRHYYWCVDDCLLGRFTPTQRAVAATLGTDPAVCDLSRVMRLPGFYHMKGAPFSTHVTGRTGARYKISEVEAAFPPSQMHVATYQPRSRATLHLAQPAQQALQLRMHVDRFGGLLTPGVRAAIAETQHGERHLMLRAIVARLVPLGWSDADVRALLLPASKASWPDVNPAELAGRLAQLLTWIRAREAGKLSIQAAAPAHVAAAFGAGRRAGSR